jgi:DNA-binding response OmpR family regulator
MASYAARLRGRVLDLTFKEFELLKFLAQHPGRVFTRAQLLQEVWGYDYFGGTRTVDVHVRRLRAKLGPEHEALIGTVRNVGYRFVPVKGERGERGQGTDRPGSAGSEDRARMQAEAGARGATASR